MIVIFKKIKVLNIFVRIICLIPIVLYAQNSVFNSNSDMEYLKKLNYKEKREILDQLNKLETKDEKKKILRALSDENDVVVKEKAIIELAKTKDLDVMDELILNLKSTDTSKVIACVEGLINFSTYTKVQVAVAELLNHKEVNIRWKAIEVCGRAKIGRCVDGIVKIINNKDEGDNIKRAAVESLYKIRTKKAVDSLKNIYLNSKDNDVKNMVDNVIKLIEEEKKK